MPPGLFDDLDPDQEPIVDGGLFSDLDPAATPARDASLRQSSAAHKAQRDAEFYGLDDAYTGTRIGKSGLLRGGLAIAGTVGTLAGNLIPGKLGDDAYAAGKSAFAESDAVGAAQSAGRAAMEAKGTPSVYSPRTEENVTGAVSGLVQAAPAMAVGPWTSIMAGAATSGAQAEHEADSAGLTGIDKAEYAAAVGGINGAVGAVFQKLGLGGKEAASIGGKLVDQSFARALAHAGIQTGAEGLQNVFIAAGTKVARKLAGTDATPNDWSRELEDAALQGLIVSGAMHAATLGGHGIDVGREALNERSGLANADAMVLNGDAGGQPLDAQAQQGAALDSLLPQRAGMTTDADMAPTGGRPFEVAEALQDQGINARQVEPSVDPGSETAVDLEPVHQDLLDERDMPQFLIDRYIRINGGRVRNPAVDRGKTLDLDMSREPTPHEIDAAKAQARGISETAKTEQMTGVTDAYQPATPSPSAMDDLFTKLGGIFDDIDPAPPAQAPLAAARAARYPADRGLPLNDVAALRARKEHVDNPPPIEPTRPTTGDETPIQGNPPIADEAPIGELSQTAKEGSDAGRGVSGSERLEERKPPAGTPRADASAVSHEDAAPGSAGRAPLVGESGADSAHADQDRMAGPVGSADESASHEAASTEVHPEEKEILDELNAKQKPAAAARIQPDPLPNDGAVKKHDEAILDLSRGMGRSIFAGKGFVAKGKGTLGTYFTGPVKTTIRYHGDLDTTAHEVGHMLDDRFGIVGQWAGRRVRSPFDAELIPNFSGHGSKGTTLAYTRAEGVAEYLRAWMVNPKAAEAAAPQFAAFVKSKIPAKILGKLRSFGDDVRRFVAKPAIEGISANVQHFGEHPDVRRALTAKLKDLFQRKGMVFETTFVDKARAEVQDMLWPAIKAIDAALEFRGINPAIGEKTSIRPENDPRILMRNLAGERDATMVMMEHGPLDLDGKGRTPGGVEWLWQPARQGRMREDIVLGENHAIAQRIAWEGRALEDEMRTKVGEMRNAGAKPKEIGDVIREYRTRIAHLAGIGGGVFSDYKMAVQALVDVSKMDDATRTVIGELNARLRQWSRANLDHLVDHGLLTKEARRAILAKNPYYVDFHRVFKEVGSPIEAFKGSTRKLDDPYVNTLAMTERVHRTAARNTALKKMVELIDAQRGMYQGDPKPFAEIGRKVPPEERSDGDGAIAVRIKKTNSEGKEEVVTEHWQFQPEVQQALERWSEAADPNMLVKMLAIPANVARWGVTHGPSFVLRNIMRDAVSRGVLSRNGSTPFDQFVPIKGEAYDRYRAYGGGQAGHYLKDKVNYHRELAKRLRQMSGDKGTLLSLPVRAARGAWQFYAEKVAQGSELVGRMAEFNRAYKKAKDVLGYDERNANLYAAYQARDLLDYAIAGHFVRKWIAPFVPFFNANIQGLARTGRGAFGEGGAGLGRFAARWGMYVALPTAAIYAWNNRDDESRKAYRQLPAWRRDMFWNVQMGPDFWLSLPKPFELGVAASGLERAADHQQGDKHAWDGYPSSLRQAFIPVGEETVVGPLAPVVEAMMNKSLFTGRDVVPSYEQGKDMALRPGADNASRLGKGIAPLLGADPRSVDQFIQSSLGNMGKLATQVSNIGRDDDKDSGSAWARTLSGITNNDPSWNARDVDAVLTEAIRRGEEQSEPIQRLRGMLKLAQKEKDPTERAKLKTEAVDYATALRTAYDKAPFSAPPSTPSAKALSEKVDRFKVTGKPEDRAAAIAFRDANLATIRAETTASTTAKMVEKVRLMLATLDTRKDLAPDQRKRMRAILERRLAELTK